MEGLEIEMPEAMQTRHRKEQRDLQSRITNKKKNATKKTRRGVNDECALLEQELKERQEQELSAAAATANSGAANGAEGNEDGDEATGPNDDLGTDVNGLAERVGDTTLSSPSSSSAATTNPDAATAAQNGMTISTKSSSSPTTAKRTANQQPPNIPAAHGGAGEEQAGGKNKRNRQKERMARRQAEQEAAAAAAEVEASSMPDRRAIEKAYLERVFRESGLVEKEIRPDGHCLFSAVADQLAERDIPLLDLPDRDGEEGEAEGKEKEPPHKTVRRAATEYMAAHADDFAPFLAGEGEDDFAGYLGKMRDTAEWGGQLELSALASRYGVEIKVVQDGRTETIEPSGQNGGEGGGEGEGKRKKRQKIWLAYYRHGYGLGEHYNSLRKAR